MSVASQVKESTALPTCPICTSPMAKRNSSRGEFFGCTNYPNCRGTRPINADRSTWNTVKFEPIVMMPGSDEQEAVFASMKDDDTHIVINAGPGCLVGSTFIDCPRDMTKYPAGIPIQDLVGQTPYVYGYSTRMKRIVLRKTVRVWKTGEKVPVYKVTFKNAYAPSRNLSVERAPFHVIGTADHPFLLRVAPVPNVPGWNSKPPIPGGWRELKDLKPGDRVIALLREFCKNETSLYLNNGEHMIESRFILSEIEGRRKSDEYHAHHKNEVHLDHTPSNLEWKTPHDHRSEHTSEFNRRGITGWQKSGVHPRGMAGKPQTANQRRRASETHLGVPLTKEHVRNMKKARWGKKVCANHIVESVEFYGYEDVYNMTVEGCHNFIANGVVTHNTGKTHTMVQGVLRLPKSLKVRGVAFNKHIATDMSGKLAASGCTNAQFSTCHSMGNAILRRQFRGMALNDGKMRDIFEKLSPEPQFNKSEWRRTLNLAAKLAGFVKNYLVDYHAPRFYAEMERLADHHGLDFKTGGGGSYRRTGDKPLADLGEAVDLVPRALDLCRQQASSVIDYDDMVWLPVVLDLPFDRCDMLIGDEQQDSNAIQHEFMMRAGEGARIVVVGDRHQSIYQFRGAHATSMEVLTDALRNSTRGVKEFPLTVTRRCPKLHVMMAQQLYPEIVALDDAPLGEILTVATDEAHEHMALGDLVLCRVNKELIGCAYKLIRRGLRPLIKGRDFGKGILSFLRSLEEASKKNYGGARDRSSANNPDEIKGLMDALDAYRREELDKLLPLGDKAEGRIEQLNDKCSCMAEMISNSASAAELRDRITRLFGLDSDEDPKMSEVVTLGTVHRTKGLEAARVFVLAPDLIPHPAARKEHELVCERNLAWVAVTRAKFDNSKNQPGTLVFCGSIPTLFDGASTVKTKEAASR
jgi:hypothetical protein